MRILTLGLVLGMILFVEPLAGIADDGVNRSTAEGWVKQLTTGSRSERATAQRELLDAGPRVLDWLPPIESIRDVAGREQLRRIRIELERRFAKESVQASQISLEAEISLADALQSISQQSGNRLQWSDLPSKTLTRTIATGYDSAPFWQVMTTLAERFNFHWKRTGFSRELQLVDGRDKSVSELQVLESVLLSVEPIKTRAIGTDGMRRLVRVRCRLEVEPRLRPLFLRMSARDVQLRDASGKALPSFNPEAQYELALGESGEVAFDADFLAADENIDVKTCVFQGKHDLIVAAGTEEIRFRNLSKANGVSRRRGGVTVSLREVAKFQLGTQTMWKTRLAVGYETGGPAFESHRTWIYHNQAFLEGPSGARQHREAGFSTELATDGGVILEYTFRDPPFQIGDTDLVYVAPTLITKLPIDFHFPQLLGPQSADNPQTERED